MQNYFLSFLSLRNLTRLFAPLLLLPVVLMWYGCPAPAIDNCTGVTSPNVTADVTYTLGVPSSIVNSDTRASWNSSSPLGRYKVVVSKGPLTGSNTVVLHDTITGTTSYRYQAVHEPNTVHKITVTPLGLNDTPCYSSARTLEVRNPNGGIITIDIVGKKVSNSSNGCTVDATTTAARPFCPSIADLLEKLRTDIAPSASSIIINLHPDLITNTCNTNTYSSWSSVPVHFLSPTNVVPVLSTGCFGTAAYIDFSPSVFSVRY